MKRHPFLILQSLLPVLALATILCVEPASAGSIRIVGDKTTTPDSSGEPAINTPPVAATRGSSTVRIVGDKPGVEEETAEQQLSRRLTAIKEEEARKLAGKTEQERLARLEAEQKGEAARQAAIKQEQELLAARKEEETRALAKKAEQERQAQKLEQERLTVRKAEEARVAAEQAEQMRRSHEISIREKAAAEDARLAAARKAAAEEERLATARKAVFEKLTPETDPVTTSVNRFDPSANLKPAAGTDTSPPVSIWDLYLSAKAIDPALGRTESRVSGSKADSDLVFSGFLPHLYSSAGVRLTSQSLFDYAATDQKYNFTAFNYNVTAQMTLLNVPTFYALTASAAALGCR